MSSAIKKLEKPTSMPNQKSELEVFLQYKEAKTAFLSMFPFASSFNKEDIDIVDCTNFTWEIQNGNILSVKPFQFLVNFEPGDLSQGKELTAVLADQPDLDDQEPFIFLMSNAKQMGGGAK